MKETSYTITQNKYMQTGFYVDYGKENNSVLAIRCDLDGLPPERVGTRGGMPTMTDMGKPAPGQWDNLPEVFVSTDGDTYKIEDIHSLTSS